MINYKEKSEESKGNIANGAVFVFGNELMEWVANNAPNAKDFCADIVEAYRKDKYMAYKRGIYRHRNKQKPG